MLKSMSIDLSFCGGTAVNEEFDLFSTSEQKSYYKRQLLRQCNKNYLMIDNTKFFRSSLFRTHNLAEYTATVSDRNLIDEERRFVEKLGINFITV